MDRIKVTQFTLTNLPKGHSFYNITTPLFNICYISNKIKNEVKMCGTFSSCRAYSTDIIRSVVLGKRHEDDAHSYYIENHGILKLSAMLLGVGFNTDIHHMVNIVNIINYYSEIGNLPKLKLIGFADTARLKLWFIKMPMKYKEKSFLTSMITLLVRVFATIKSEVLETLKSIDDVEDYFYIHKKNKDNGFGFNDRHTLYGTDNYLKLRMVMQHHRKLFFGQGNKKLFPFGVGYKFHDKSGINSLCTAITLNKVLNERSKKMLKVEKVIKNEETKVKEEKVYTTKT